MRPNRNSLKEVRNERPEMFGPEDDPAVAAEPVAATVEAVEVGRVEALTPNGTPQRAMPVDAFLRACSDGMGIPTQRAKLDIQESAGRMLDDYIRIGKRLFIIKENLSYGDFANYITEEFPLSNRVARECMLLAKRIIESKVAPGRNFDYQGLASNSKQKALLLLGISDDEIQTAQESGELMGVPLEEVGEMSYRQLKAELAKRTRDLDRTRGQRDKAEEKVADLQDTVTILKDGVEAARKKDLTDLEMEFGRLCTQCARVLRAAQDADEDEIVRDGVTYQSRLMREVNLLTDVFRPFEPTDPLYDDLDVAPEGGAA